jgi:hypothetical protein
MSFKAPIGLPPTRADLAVTRAAARGATPATERPLQVITWLADEKMVLGGAILLWLYARAVRPEKDLKHRRRIIFCAASLWPVCCRISSNGWFVGDARIAPSCTAAGTGSPARAMHGIPFRPGMRYISAQSPVRLPAEACVLLALAASRILLLAHYPSDVAAGLALGVALDKSMGRVSGASRAFFLSAIQGRKRTM